MNNPHPIITITQEMHDFKYEEKLVLYNDRIEKSWQYGSSTGNEVIGLNELAPYIDYRSGKPEQFTSSLERLGMTIGGLLVAGWLLPNDIFQFVGIILCMAGCYFAYKAYRYAFNEEWLIIKKQNQDDFFFINYRYTREEDRLRFKVEFEDLMQQHTGITE